MKMRVIWQYKINISEMFVLCLKVESKNRDLYNIVYKKHIDFETVQKKAGLAAQNAREK